MMMQPAGASSSGTFRRLRAAASRLLNGAAGSSRQTVDARLRAACVAAGVAVIG